MILGIEASRANRPQKTGVEWYAHHLIQALKKLPESAAHSWLLYSNTPLMQGLEIGSSNWHERRLPWPPKYLWTQIRLSLEMLFRPPDVLFVPAHVLPRIIPRRSVVTLHDVGFHRFPQLYKPRQVAIHEYATKDILRRASRIITVSAFSKQELMDCYQADPEKIIVTHLGIDHSRYQSMAPEAAEKILRHWLIQSPFFVFIGRLERKKNVSTLVRAFNVFKEKRDGADPTELVLVGQPGAGYEEIEQAIGESPWRDKIKIVGYVTEEEKVALLSKAIALVHPSWYEGFGLTPLEAMACGCPVICSHTASLPEVVGENNVLWFEPGDAEGLSDQLSAINDQRSTFIERGLQWVKRYTWDETARQTLEVLTRW